MNMLVEECQALSDAEVIERVLAGESGLYELLMRRYNQRVYRVIRSVITNDTEAEDVLQEAWVRAYEHLRQFDGRASFATWVARIGFYEALARTRKAQRRVPLETDSGDIVPEVNRSQTAAETPETQAMLHQLGETLRTAVERLPETYRAVFVLRQVEQLSTSETADVLGLSEESVKTRLHRARALLRGDLEVRIGSATAEVYPFMGERCDRTVARVLERIAAYRD